MWVYEGIDLRKKKQNASTNRVNKLCIKSKTHFSKHYIIEQIIKHKPTNFRENETNSIRYLKFKKLLIYKLKETEKKTESLDINAISCKLNLIWTRCNEKVNGWKLRSDLI